ncbi:MAG: heavy metal translocating P-type ATPase [Candidatus Nealsonbacteria bacterium]|nr:MAG: heavy metal translocating P-type ATPase [Candidatus Nealsonbacteria bacterium]
MQHNKHQHMRHDANIHHDTGHDHHRHMVADFKKRFIISTVLTIPVLLLSDLIQKFLKLDDVLKFTGDKYVLFTLSTVIFFYGGWPFLKGAYNELKSKRPGMMTLIGLAISVAYIYSSAVVFGLEGKFFFWEIVTLIDIMLLGHWIEMKSVMGASRALEELVKLMPQEAHKVTREGKTIDIPIEELKKSDRVLVKPGEKFPADGIILDGETSVNEAMLTGESRPVAKSRGQEVIGGSINGEGSVTVEVKKTGEDSFISGVIKLVQEAQASKSRTQDLANRAAFWLTMAAISAGTITLIVWLFVINKDLAFSLERTVTVMVITCPHALGLAIPLVVAVSTAISARNGLLIRNRTAFEKARKIDAIIFDKTGTLTRGEFGVTDVISLSESFNDSEILKYAASLEERSEHPIARAIAASTEQRYKVTGFKSITGKGVQARVNGKEVKVVSPGYLKENNIKLNDNSGIDKLNQQGKTVIFILVDNRLIGAVALADIIREESKEAIRKLKEMDIKPMMLTGDNEQVARWVAEEVGIEEYFAEVLPQDKSNKIKEVQSRGLVVAMTGDGVNDAPALAQADIGIAIGAGTDVAVETADIILVRSNPLDAVSILGLSRATYRKMLQNLGWATGYNAVAIPLAAGVLFPLGIILSPAVGAALMSLSTVIVAINSRFLRVTR